MKKLNLLLLGYFVPVFLGSLLFFSFLINGADLLFSIVRYMERDVPFATILYLQYLYIPFSIVSSIPIALLFSVSFSMGTLYANNELIAVFASGISLRKFITPLIAISALLSISLFVIQDQFAIPMSREKVSLSAELLRTRPRSLSQTDITIQSNGGTQIYQAEFYDAQRLRLDGLSVLIRDADNSVQRIFDAQWAEWNGEFWHLYRVTEIVPASRPDQEMDIIERSDYPVRELVLPPENFQNQFGDIDEMSIEEARQYIDYLKAGGFPYRKELTRYHERYSFAFTPLIVTLLSAGIGGRYRRNILAMSLLVSLGLSIVYYSIQMLTGLFASLGYLDSMLGAWTGTLLTAAAAAYILSRART